ncbi:MAG TPA: hypothetical protein VFL42_06940, partial [Terriglobales bacterium]|nr:hypothetical protein [Terriglobales bacterium]
MSALALPKVKRPAGISLLSALVALSALALLIRTLATHPGGFAGVFRLLAVLVLILVSAGLWLQRNSARVFLFYLLVSNVIGCATALFLYALRQHQNRLSLFLVVQIAISVVVLWYLRKESVGRAFAAFSPWPQTVKMLVLTIFTVA